MLDICTHEDKTHIQFHNESGESRWQFKGLEKLPPVGLFYLELGPRMLNCA